MTEEEKIRFLVDRGWSESCLHEGYWNPPQGVRLPPLGPEPETGGGWGVAVGMRLVVTLDEAITYEQGKARDRVVAATMAWWKSGKGPLVSREVREACGELEKTFEDAEPGASETG
jgi:hypothetical protein